MATLSISSLTSLALLLASSPLADHKKSKELWWIKNDQGKEEGPFTFSGLRHHPGITPDSWGRREGETLWRRLRHIPELRSLFQDPLASSDGDEEASSLPCLTPPLSEEATLTLQQAPSPLLFWLLISLLIYSLYLYLFD